MSKEAITKVVQRAISDAGFRRQLSTDPTGALRGFDLSADEAAALRMGDAGRLSALGVDQRMSKAFALGGAAAVVTRKAASDLSVGDASAATRFSDGNTGGISSNALVEGADVNSAMIDDGASGIRTIIPNQPGGTITADLDPGSAGSGRSVNDDPDGFLAANKDADFSGGTTRAINDDADGFLAANKDADFSGGTTRAINDDADGFLAANKDADLSGGTTGETAFVDDSEGYLTKVGYDPNVATSAVTDAHDRGSLGTSAVTDAHDRGDVTRIDDDADGGATGAASEHGPNISS